MGKVLVLTLLLSVLATVMIFGSVSPIFAGSDGESYKKYQVVSIGDAVGTIEISEDTNIDDVKDQAISEEDATEGYDVDKAKLKKAVNDSDQYFLVWKLVDFTDSGTMTIYVLDAGTGEQLIEPVIKEKGMCTKSQSTNSGDNA